MAVVSRLLVIARMMPRQTLVAPVTPGDPARSLSLLFGGGRAKAVLETWRGRSMAFWGSFACIFLLIPLF